MAWEAIQQQISAPAAANLSSNLFCAVQFDTNGNCAIANAAKNIDGVLQNKPSQGQAADMCVFGITKVQVSATTTAGQLLQVDATGNGSFAPVSSGTAVAKALDGSGTVSSGTVVITALLLKSNAVYV